MSILFFTFILIPGTCFQYEDLGHPTYICSHCGAIMWYEERSNKSQNTMDPEFSLCCQKGKVSIPHSPPPPEFLRRLFDYNGDELSRYFMRHIREINSTFSFTSTGAYVDSSTHDGQGPPTFRTSGMNYHCISSLYPNNGDRPRFAQLYMYDTENETYNHIMSFGDGNYTEYDETIINGLIHLFDEHNQLVRFFHMARDRFTDTTLPPIMIRLLSSWNQDCRYNLPTSNEVVGLFDGIDEDSGNHRDILVYPWNSEPRTIDFFHPKRCALHFPLFLVYGEDGYHLQIYYVTSNGALAPSGTVTPMEFYAFQFQQHHFVDSPMLKGGQLFQKYAVDAYCVTLESRFR